MNAAQVIDKTHIKVRTYERGVEAETLACGTGATAVALAAGRCYGLQGPLHIQTKLGERLTIGFKLKENQFSNVTLTGTAHCAFRGFVEF